MTGSLVVGDIAAPSSPAGGGSAAALVAATAAALVEKAAGIAGIDHVTGEAARLRGRALDLAEEDATAYAPVREAYRLPRGPEHDARIREAIGPAIEVPRRIAEVASRVAELCDLLEASSSRKAWRADVEVARLAARAAAAGAGVLEQTNLQTLRRHGGTP